MQDDGRTPYTTPGQFVTIEGIEYYRMVSPYTGESFNCPVIFRTLHVGNQPVVGTRTAAFELPQNDTEQ